MSQCVTRAKKGKEKVSKRSKKTSLASQEVSDLDFEGTEPIRTPTTSATSGSTNSGSGRKKSPTPVTNITNDIDWGIGDTGGWQAFDTGTGSNGNDIFVDNDGFFPNDAFGSGDAFAPKSSPSVSSKSHTKSPKQRTTSSGGSSSGSGGRKTAPSKKLSTGRLRKDVETKRGEKSGKKKARSRSTLTM